MENMELPPRPKLFDFHGVSMTHYFTDNWENIQNFQARPDDILIATYPKAGTTWVSYILDLLYFGQTAPERQTSLPIYERVPFLESDFHILPPGTELADKLTTSPRLIKTHLPVQLLPKSFWEQNCRVVYVARNAKDNAVSYFHFDRMNQADPEPGDWNNFLQRFMDGKMVFGPWYDHVTGWWERKETHSKLHYIFYEDMVESEVLFLGHRISAAGIEPDKDKFSAVTDMLLPQNVAEVITLLGMVTHVGQFLPQNSDKTEPLRELLAKENDWSWGHMQQAAFEKINGDLAPQRVLAQYRPHSKTKDMGRELDRLCSFLGLSPSAEEKERVRGGVQFDTMKKNSMANYSTVPIMDFKISPFMRKGKVGDWKNHFTVAQSEQFDEDYKKKMKNTTVQFRTVV